MPPTTTDVKLIAMIRRHAGAWSRWGRLAKQNERDPRIDALADECCELEPIIVAMPAVTKAGLAAKRRMIAKVGYAAVNGRRELATGDVGALVDAILTLDAERVAAAAT